MARKTIRLGLALAAGTLGMGALAVAAVHNFSFLTLAERIVEDVRTAMILPTEPQDPNVVIVPITEDTLARFPYREPVDRAFLSNLLRMLEARKPRVIALDILFDQPTEPAKDELLKQTIRSLSVPLVISYLDNPQVVDDQQKAYLDSFVPTEERAWAQLPSDADGTVRWIFPGARQRDGTYLMGVARTVAARTGVATPDTPQETVWHGQPDADTTPFAELPAQLVPALPAEWFAGKIVLIGEVVSLNDRHRTPFSIVYPSNKGDLAGIEIHAHAISQLIEGRHPRRLSWPAEIMLVLALAALGTAFGALNRGLARHLGLAALTLAVLWPAGFALHRHAGIMIPLVEPSLAFLLATWGADAVTGREARRQREFIHSAFSRYLSPQLVKQLSQDPERLRLGGESREMTLMFCDIRGFTTISELFDAPGLTRLINRFLTPMTDVILERKGTIDKYMGDCIMAFWNAPLDDPEHAANACRAALAMIEGLRLLNEELETEAKAEKRRHVPLDIGIGLNSGPVVVGNMGSHQRFDYSALGDNVNLASRLEGQSKTYGVTVVIGENTRTIAPGFACLELDLIKVKGKTEAVRIFTLLGDEAVAASEDFAALTAEHQAMLAAYRRQEWDEAENRLTRLRDHDRGFRLGKLLHLYAERIAGYRASPPAPDWDGVYVATSK